MENNRTSQASLPECLESPSGSSFGSLEALGVAHPTKGNKDTRIRTSVENPEKRKSGVMLWLLLNTSSSISFTDWRLLRRVSNNGTTTMHLIYSSTVTLAICYIFIRSRDQAARQQKHITCHHPPLHLQCSTDVFHMSEEPRAELAQGKCFSTGQHSKAKGVDDVEVLFLFAHS